VINDINKLESKILPENLNYSLINGLRLEARQKLNKIKPLNLAQASRISGVSPADITVLLVYLSKK
ncbi:MAG: tRNA uridine-5-carboxymethylaminomethyl(34) synthesis enzyme MnmG, partial [Clostridia bacterium]|nr:tRNA uridine-5-carboxymethylaminomethyl(34) synthesis enzyme MnmG [Clostridia bacterium]